MEFNRGVGVKRGVRDWGGGKGSGERERSHPHQVGTAGPQYRRSHTMHADDKVTGC